MGSRWSKNKVRRREGRQQDERQRRVGVGHEERFGPRSTSRVDGRLILPHSRDPPVRLQGAPVEARPLPGATLFCWLP